MLIIDGWKPLGSFRIGTGHHPEDMIDQRVEIFCLTLETLGRREELKVVSHQWPVINQ